jgi:tetrahydromethanopterin S-methyltransferase subunit C
MENVKETYKKSEHSANSNATSHYQLMTIGIIIGLVGIMLRFVSTWVFIDIVSNIIFVIGIVLSVKAVLNILK